MKKNRLILATLLTLSLVQVSAHADGTEATKLGDGFFTVASDVPAEQSKQLASDMDFLHALPVQGSARLQKLMETGEPVSTTSLENWLAERVQYVVSENMDLDRSVLGSEQEYPYQNPGIFPPVNPPKSRSALGSTRDMTADRAGIITVMANVGVSIYLNAKQAGRLAGVQIPGVAGPVPMTSPRTGVIQIGEGMFQPLMQKNGLVYTDSPAYKVFRLAVLFHEARHSDGNGESTGFLHTTCPLGHDYEGASSCDLALNGAYTIGAEILTTLSSACKECTTQEKEVLKLEALDSVSRVLASGPKYRREAQNLVQCQELSQGFMAQFRAAKSDWNYCQDLLHRKIEMVEASDWDATPEGIRN